MKKRKWLLAVIAAASALACTIGFAACGDDTATPPPSNGDQADNAVHPHTHSWATDWSKDVSSHWHACASCNEKKDEAPHDFTNGNCVCGKAVSQGLAFELNEDGNTYSVAGIGDCTDTEIIIPAEYDEKPVTVIGDEAFAECTSFTSIFVPGNVTEINCASFFNCTSLENVFISNGLTKIAEAAFIQCTSLKSINIPESVTEIGEAAFSYCSSLTEITVDENNRNYVFQNGALYNIDKTVLMCVPANINAASFSIPDGVIIIDYAAFSDCTSLKSVSIPQSVNKIGYGAFESCNSLENITIPNGVVEIGETAFWFCSSLKSVSISETVTEIGWEAFTECSSLTNITVNEDNSSFASLDGILFNKDKTTIICVPAGKDAITIPASVNSFRGDALNSCYSLTSFTVDENNMKYSSQDGILYNKDKTRLVIAPMGMKGEIQIPNGVINIDDGACSRCTHITSIILPNSVTEIGSSAFSGCTSLKSITIPESVTKIQAMAFSECRALESITFEGTRAQWEAITKGHGWDTATGDYTVHCSDD